MKEGIMLTSLDAKGMKKINFMWKIQMVSVHTSITTLQVAVLYYYTITCPSRTFYDHMTLSRDMIT